MKTGTIKQIVSFSAKPEIVYDLIMDAKKHSAFTGGPVEMSKKSMVNSMSLIAIFRGII